MTMRFSKIKILALTAFVLLSGFSTVAEPLATNSPPRLSPGPNDGRIAYVTARLMEEYQYSQQPLDAEMSEKFFDGYLETLDPRHENFLQSDIAEFSHWRTNLDTLTIGDGGTANLTPAFVIFQRFLERLEQHVAYVDKLLKRDKFRFNGDDRYVFDRRHLPYPKDLDAAKKLWRNRLRFEYLQEKVSREISTNDEIIKLPKSAAAEITETLEKHYNWNLHMATNQDSTDVLSAYLNALTHAYDPHSDYMNNEHAQDFSIEMSLSLFGIGAQLSEDDGYCTISALVPGGPAAKSKQLKEKDRIIAVAQGHKPPVDVVDMELTKVVQLIRGPKGSEVRLTISPVEDRSARRIVSLTREQIKLQDSAAKAILIESPDGKGATNRIGIIDLPSFYATIPLPGNEGMSPKFTSVDVAKLIKKLKQEHAGGIILDLRNNPGGSLEEAVKFTGLFIKDGPVVLARNPDGQVEIDSDNDPDELYSGPLVVLVNRFSASAAEIAAAALQDYGRAVIVGDSSTHGKGTVQNLNPLRPFVWPATKTATNDPGTVKITIRKFYRVSGASTQLKGVVPNIILPDIWNYSTEVGETSLENPLPWDTIPSVSYDKLDLVQPYLNQLREASDARIATNQDFIYIRQDIEQFKKLQADKSATLNERETLKEHRQNDERKKARDKEIEARPLPNEKIYEITVENSGKPGLPPPMSLMVTNGFAGASMTSSNATVATVETVTNESPGIKPPVVTVQERLETSAVAMASSPPSGPPILGKSPVITDATLNETENILEDYISLLSKRGIMETNQ
ncbi:MAG: carboxy terminal-processing peptidase [Limisphaerales bacterium]